MARIRLSGLVVAALVLGVGAGCNSGYYTVTGQVLYEDGTPVTEGTVACESLDADAKLMAQGEIGSDGRFELGTGKPKSGALPGKYRVIVIARALGDAEAAEGKELAVDSKYSNYNTSKLEYEVTTGTNDWKITVSRPKKK